MPRVKRGAKRREKRKKLLARAKGYFLGKSKLYKFAKEATERAGNFAYIGRKRKKRDFRRLWIIRINAAARAHETSYSQLMAGLKRAGILLDRKSLAEIAAKDDRGLRQARGCGQVGQTGEGGSGQRLRPKRGAPTAGVPPGSNMGNKTDELRETARALRAEFEAGGAGDLGLGRAAGLARPLPRPQVGSALGAAEVARAGR